MKKLTSSSALILALILALSACSGNNAPASTTAAPALTTTAAESQQSSAAETTTQKETTAATVGNDSEYGTVVIENGDRTVTFTSMPQKVLCANLYAAENMVMLGLEDHIVGKNVHTNPAEVPLPELADKFENIPEIERSLENAVALGTDLVIGQISTFKDTAWGSFEQLESNGINCLTITGTIVPDETVEHIYIDIGADQSG